MNNLSGKKALVTGGASGIGAAIVEELALLGCDVFIHFYSSREAGDTLSRKLIDKGATVELIQGDLSNEEGLSDFLDDFRGRMDSLDILINNAGDLVERRNLSSLDFGFYRKLSDLNVNSMIQVSRGCLDLLKKAGDGASIVNVSSLAGRKGGHGGSLAYATAKGAVLTFTRALSAELAGFGIRVNAVAPGLILGTRFHATHTTEDSAMKTINGIPLGRAGNPEDVARAVAFLASEYSGFITGATVDINGGVYSA